MTPDPWDVPRYLPHTHSERPTMPTLTAPVLVWYQCQICRVSISKKRPGNPEAVLERALNHVRDTHVIAYPDSLAMVIEHRPKA